MGRPRRVVREERVVWRGEVGRVKWSRMASFSFMGLRGGGGFRIRAWGGGGGKRGLGGRFGGGDLQ